MSKQWQVIPLDVLQEGVRNARRRSRQKAHTAQESTAGSTRQANTQGKSEQLIQPVTALLFMAALTKQQEQAIPKQQNQPAIKQQEQPAAAAIRQVGMNEPILDEWLERLTRPSPAKRAKGQLRDLAANSRTTLKQLAKHPHDNETAHILYRQHERETAIMQRGKKPPPARCTVCNKPLPGPPVNFWTNNPGLKLGWALLVAVLFLMLGQVIEWWAFVVFPVGWLLSLSFFWTITVPVLLLLLLLPFTLFL
jgi:hypothetical protein